MHIEELFRSLDGAGEIVNEDGGCRGCENGIGADRLRGVAQDFSFQFDDLGDTFEDHARAGERLDTRARRDDRNPAHNDAPFGLLQHADPRQSIERLVDLIQRLGFKLGELLSRPARFDVDHGDGMPGISKGDRDPTSHPAGAEASDR